ncbi:HXXEE domain-containing protein [Kribbella deserti]|uniref:HXXEE domain-containing protein n=1 Tax=Kribbella deserti TaxID=1926257 RepID=A0ABV6QDI3_9ACTN
MKLAWGLLAAWILHDLEELATMPRWSHQAPDQINTALRSAFPATFPSTSPSSPGATHWVPSGSVHSGLDPVLRSALPMSRAEAATAIGLVGVVMAAASVQGARTGGRSALFQSASAGFALHAVTHLAQSAALRRYTPGLMTTPLVVIPYALWARREMRNIPKAPTNPALTTALALAVPAAHLLARLPRLRHSPRTRPPHPPRPST